MVDLMTDLMRCLCSYAVVGFHQMWCCLLWPNVSIWVSSVQRTLFQKSSSLFRCNFCKPSLYLLGCPLLGRLATIFSIFHFWIILFTVEGWSSYCLEIVFALWYYYWKGVEGWSWAHVLKSRWHWSLTRSDKRLTSSS